MIKKNRTLDKSGRFVGFGKIVQSLFTKSSNPNNNNNNNGIPNKITFDENCSQSNGNTKPRLKNIFLRKNLDQRPPSLIRKRTEDEIY